MIKQITIIGVGLIGGSVALACKENNLVEKIIGYSRKQSTLHTAQKLNIIDQGFCDIKQAVENADIIIICTPLSSYYDLAVKMSPYLKDDVIICDAGSVKYQPSQDFIKGLDSKFHSRFVPTHPIAGTEKSGPEAAFASLYDNKKIIITPLEKTDETAINIIAQLWQDIGGNIEFLNAQNHDNIYATVSHIVQFLSYAYSLSLHDLDCRIIDELNKNKDDNYRKFMRLSGSDPAMWRDILIINQKYILKQIALFQQHLKQLIGKIADDKQAQLSQYLVHSRDKRLEFHEILKGGKHEQFRPSNYQNISAETLIWIDILPRIIAAILMGLITEDEYQYATSAGFQSLSKNIILENATNITDIFANKEAVIKHLRHFTSVISDINQLIEGGNSQQLKNIFFSSQEIYTRIIN